MDNPFKKFAEEWKKATPKEKLMIVGAAASVVAIALYLHHKTSSSAPGTGLAGLPSNLSPASTGSTGTTGTTGSTGSTTTGSTDTGSFSAPAPINTGSFYAPPPYTGTGTPSPSYTAPSAAPNAAALAGQNVANSVLAAHNASMAPHVLTTPLQPGSASTAPLAQAPVGSTYQPGRTAVVSPTGISAPGLANIRSQPTVLAGTYSAIRHAPAPAPVSTQQVVQPLRQIPRKAIAG